MTDKALVLRVCAPDFTSSNDFQWPSEIGAVAEAPDWDSKAECGNGLHGWLFGHGDYSVSTHYNDLNAKWMVLEVDQSSIVMLGGKCKFPKAKIMMIGTKSEAAAYIISNEERSKPDIVIGSVVAVGDKETACAGALGTATAGNSGTATAGDYGTATAGNYGTATAGNSGTATAGDSGTATAGDYGTATAGNYGTATAGYYGTATAGDYGTATAGDYGTATAGYYGEIRIRYWDKKAERYRTKIGYIGEDGLKPNTPYVLNDKHEFVEKEQ